MQYLESDIQNILKLSDRTSSAKSETFERLRQEKI